MSASSIRYDLYFAAESDVGSAELDDPAGLEESVEPADADESVDLEEEAEAEEADEPDESDVPDEAAEAEEAADELAEADPEDFARAHGTAKASWEATRTTAKTTAANLYVTRGIVTPLPREVRALALARGVEDLDDSVEADQGRHE